jgi:SAM-dependent methyltransferase
MVCKVCGNVEGNRELSVREMMFGEKGSFLYFECLRCKCLQIKDIPVDLGDYYPEEYYSFKPVEESPGALKRLNRWLTVKRNRFYFFRKSFLGMMIHRFVPNHRLHMISLAGLTIHDRILDVGCGNGLLIHHMKDAGFKHLLGIDPFLNDDMLYQNDLVLKKMSLEEVAGEYDLVMFHHSFEHMAEPEQVLSKVSSLLKEGGQCLIRVPTASSYAWRHYGADWVQIDAPRHLFLHSKESIGYLAEKAGLYLERYVYDSGEFQFWGSEQHKMGIPLYSEKSYLINRSHSLFSNKQIRGFAREARRLNKENAGDTCAFFLRKR